MSALRSSIMSSRCADPVVYGLSLNPRFQPRCSISLAVSPDQHLGHVARYLDELSSSFVPSSPLRCPGWRAAEPACWASSPLEAVTAAGTRRVTTTNLNMGLARSVAFAPCCPDLGSPTARVGGDFRHLVVGKPMPTRALNSARPFARSLRQAPTPRDQLPVLVELPPTRQPRCRPANLPPLPLAFLWQRPRSAVLSERLPRPRDLAAREVG